MQDTEVLVALDGSEKGERALSTGLAVSELADSSVHLVHVAASPGEKIDFENQLARAAREAATRSRRPISWEVIENADVARALIRVAEARDAAAVVMGTRAAGSVGRAILGSVADEVVRECSKPVVVVPPGSADLRGKLVEITRILVPLDGSGLADRSIDFLLELPLTRELEVVALGVVHNADDVAYVRRRLRVAADRFRGYAADATARVMFGGDVAVAVAAATREFLVDMIVMTTRGEGGLRRLILGSVAQEVVRAAEVPVLLLTPTMLAAQPGVPEMVKAGE